MKNLLKPMIAFAIVSLFCFGCSAEQTEDIQQDNALETDNTSMIQDAPDTCTDQNPQARISNNGTASITLEIASIDGTIIHTVIDLAPGNTSAYLSFAPEDTIFNVIKNVSGVGDEKLVYTMEMCMIFDMEVGSDNYLVPSTPVVL